MSREDVEVVWRVMDAEGRREKSAIFALYDEDIEWDVSGAGGGGRGHRDGTCDHYPWRQDRAAGYEDPDAALAAIGD